MIVTNWAICSFYIRVKTQNRPLSESKIFVNLKINLSLPLCLWDYKLVQLEQYSGRKFGVTYQN